MVLFGNINNGFSRGTECFTMKNKLSVLTVSMVSPVHNDILEVTKIGKVENKVNARFNFVRHLNQVSLRYNCYNSELN